MGVGAVVEGDAGAEGGVEGGGDVEGDVGAEGEAVGKDRDPATGSRPTIVSILILTFANLALCSLT